MCPPARLCAGQHFLLILYFCSIFSFVIAFSFVQNDASFHVVNVAVNVIMSSFRAPRLHSTSPSRHPEQFSRACPGVAAAVKHYATVILSSFRAPAQGARKCEGSNTAANDLCANAHVTPLRTRATSPPPARLEIRCKRYIMHKRIFITHV